MVYSGSETWFAPSSAFGALRKHISNRDCSGAILKTLNRVLVSCVAGCRGARDTMSGWLPWDKGYHEWLAAVGQRILGQTCVQPVQSTTVTVGCTTQGNVGLTNRMSVPSAPWTRLSSPSAFISATRPVSPLHACRAAISDDVNWCLAKQAYTKCRLIGLMKDSRRVLIGTPPPTHTHTHTSTHRCWDLIAKHIPNPDCGR